MLFRKEVMENYLRKLYLWIYKQIQKQYNDYKYFQTVKKKIIIFYY